MGKQPEYGGGEVSLGTEGDGGHCGSWWFKKTHRRGTNCDPGGGIRSSKNLGQRMKRLKGAVTEKKRELIRGCSGKRASEGYNRGLGRSLGNG